jgi:hypothetical protein
MPPGPPRPATQVPEAMRARISCLMALVILALLPQQAALAADAKLALPSFQALESKASETVSITLDSPLIAMAARFLDSDKPEDAAARRAIAGITGIYVRSFTFDSDFAYPKADVDSVRRQLSAPGWQQLVQVHSRKERNDVDVYIRVEGNRANGLAIIASEPREFTIVNIVGSIDLQKLHELEGHFGIPQMDLTDKK